MMKMTQKSKRTFKAGGWGIVHQFYFVGKKIIHITYWNKSHQII